MGVEMVLRVDFSLRPEEAEAELQRIRQEGTGNAVDVTKLFGGME